MTVTVKGKVGYQLKLGNLVAAVATAAELPGVRWDVLTEEGGNGLAFMSRSQVTQACVAMEDGHLWEWKFTSIDQVFTIRPEGWNSKNMVVRPIDWQDTQLYIAPPGLTWEVTR